MADRETIVERIKKLLALSSSDNQFEAELALARVNELMRKYMVDEAEIALSSAEQEEITTVHYAVPNLKMKLLWVETLLTASACLFDCRVIVFTGNESLHGTRVLFAGFPDDIKAATYTFEFLWNSWNKFVAHDVKLYRDDWNERNSAIWGRWKPKDTMTFKQSHGAHYARVIEKRVKALIDARKAEVAAIGVTGRQLVAVKDAKLQEYMDGNTTDVKARPMRNSNAAGRMAGAQRGKEVNLHSGLEGGRERERLT